MSVFQDTVQPPRRAFALPDLLAVLGAAGLVGALVATPLIRAGRAARLARCLANLGAISKGVAVFAQNHQQSLPGPVAGQQGDLWWWYKEQVKGQMPDEATGVWGCPDDRGYSDPKPFKDTPRFDNTSYVFNAVSTPGAPNIAGWPLASISDPKRTLLVMEWTAHAPLSWHRSRTGSRNAPFYRDAESVTAFVDGHAALTRIYYDGFNPAFMQDPIQGYDYRYSGN
jgi:hypothetical protein